MRISDWSSDVCSSDLPASELHLFLRKGQRLTGCHPDHLFHQIKASDALGYWVLNLKTRIHFQEIEALVGPHDEFDCACAIIADSPGQLDSLLTHRLARFGINEGRRCFFNDLLMSTLDRAFAFTQINDVAMLIAQHRSENTSELQSLMRISYAVFCLK